MFEREDISNQEKVYVILDFPLLKEWPLTGLWAIGTLVGFNLLFASPR